MTFPELLAWQWSDYPAKHRHPLNLTIHLLAVPLFMAGSVLGALGVLLLFPAPIVSGLAAMIVSVGLEGVGHRFEAEPPAPFTGGSNFLRRFFVEQWVTFPRFVASGRFFRNLAGRGAA